MSVTKLTTPADIISVLKDYGFEDYDDNQFLTLMNDVQNDVCALEPWPFLESTNTSIQTIAGSSTLSLPSNWTAILSCVNTDTGDTLVPVRWDEINKNYSNYLNQTGRPQAYYFQGEQAYLYPVPDTVYNLMVAFQDTPTDLTTTSSAFTWPTRHLRCIVLGCLVQLYQWEDDKETAAYYQSMFDSRLDRARNDIWMRQYDRNEVIADVMGDNWWY